MDKQLIEELNMEATQKVGRVSDSLDTIVRCCGSCKHFDNEDICGGGWCVATDHATACGDSCPDWHDDFYTPNPTGQPRTASVRSVAPGCSNSEVQK